MNAREKQIKINGKKGFWAWFERLGPYSAFVLGVLITNIVLFIKAVFLCR